MQTEQLVLGIFCKQNIQDSIPGSLYNFSLKILMMPLVGITWENLEELYIILFFITQF